MSDCAIAIPATPGAARVVDLLKYPVIAAFKRGGRWWVVVDGEPEAVIISVEDFLNEKAGER